MEDAHVDPIHPEGLRMEILIAMGSSVAFQEEVSCADVHRSVRSHVGDDGRSYSRRHGHIQ